MTFLIFAGALSLITAVACFGYAVLHASREESHRAAHKRKAS